MPPASRGLARLFVRFSHPLPITTFYHVSVRRYARPVRLRSPIKWQSGRGTKPAGLEEEQELQQSIPRRRSEHENSSADQEWTSESFPADTASSRKPFFNAYLTPTSRRWLYRLLMIAPPLLLLYTEFPVSVLYVQGGSMAPTLNPDYDPDVPSSGRTDTVVVQRVTFGNYMLQPKLSKWEVERGDIVVYTQPITGTRAIKRIVGVPGDIVTPLEGYEGLDGEEKKAVVVPYNHLWVEGDVNVRKKSFDSNWYGPISQNLVDGFVKLVRGRDGWRVLSNDGEENSTYPAKRDGRVEENAVTDAMINPDQKAISQGWENGTAERELQTIRMRRADLPTVMRNPIQLLKLRKLYEQAVLVVEHGDEKTSQVARGIEEELGAAFEAVGLNRDGTRNQTPPPPAPDGKDEMAKQRLQRYLEKNKAKTQEDG